MPTLQEFEQPLDESIVNHLVQATPGWWKAAVLIVVRSTGPTGVEGFAHEITSPEGHRDIVMATDEIFELTIKLSDLFTRFGKTWKKAIYSIQEKPEGGWSYSAKFEY